MEDVNAWMETTQNLNLRPLFSSAALRRRVISILFHTGHLKPRCLNANSRFLRTPDDKEVDAFPPAALTNVPLKKKTLQCQSSPLTRAKSCQAAAQRIYFNKLQAELFFPGVSPGFFLSFF